MTMNRRLLLGATGALTLTACSTQQMLNVALSRSPEAAVRNMAQSRVNSYTYNPQLALADLRRIKNEYDKLVGNLQKESGEQWGKRESGTLPSRTRYVKYTENYKNRVLISPDADEHIAYLQHFVDLGFDEIYVHNVGREQGPFLKIYGEKVVPAIKWPETSNTAQIGVKTAD